MGVREQDVLRPIRHEQMARPISERIVVQRHCGQSSGFDFVVQFLGEAEDHHRGNTTYFGFRFLATRYLGAYRLHTHRYAGPSQRIGQSSCPLSAHCQRFR